tara:strand:- start:9280 stop:9633 length:354 start_codon:yes stop_codon:yes gene_type:complete
MSINYWQETSRSKVDDRASRSVTTVMSSYNAVLTAGQTFELDLYTVFDKEYCVSGYVYNADTTNPFAMKTAHTVDGTYSLPQVVYPGQKVDLSAMPPITKLEVAYLSGNTLIDIVCI